MRLGNFGIWSAGYLVIDLLMATAPSGGVEMSEQSELLKERTMSFAINMLRLIDKFPQTPGAKVIAYQLAKCSTSVGANYRAAYNGRSRVEFIAKLGVVVEEAEESVYWLEIVNRLQLVPGRDAPAQLQESIEVRAIFSRSLGTARLNLRSQRVDRAK